MFFVYRHLGRARKATEWLEIFLALESPSAARAYSRLRYRPRERLAVVTDVSLWGIGGVLCQGAVP
eukprot:3471384-Lingulodinium_polyedra.AAC.1